jgi:hypothetical protein
MTMAQQREHLANCRVNVVLCGGSRSNVGLPKQLALGPGNKLGHVYCSLIKVEGLVELM